MQPSETHPGLKTDLALMVFLIALDVAARLLPHAPGVWPVAATALFAGRVFRNPALALIVPLAATGLSNLALPGDDWRVELMVAVALLVPVFAGMASRRFAGMLPVVVAMVGSSLAFFLITNFAVWAFNGMYPMTAQGLAACYIAALPFLDRTVFGDLAWAGALFGGAWLVQHGPALAAARSKR